MICVVVSAAVEHISWIISLSVDLLSRGFIICCVVVFGPTSRRVSWSKYQ